MLSMEFESLKSLIENYNLGMNIFRRAQGGRSALREESEKKTHTRLVELVVSVPIAVLENYPTILHTLMI